MDMQTVTTAHLAAEAAKASSHAAAAMDAAHVEGDTPQALAEVERYYSTGKDDLEREAVAPAQAPSLADMLAERNAIVARLNAAPPEEEEDNEELKRTWSLEKAIVAQPCRSIEDAAAKVTLFETINGEGLMWNDASAWNMVVDIAPLVRAAAEGRPAEVPHPPIVEPAPLQLPTDLAAIVAAAEEYYARFWYPADRIHAAADVANVENEDPSKDEALSATEKRLWEEWYEHDKIYRSIADQILDGAPATPEELLSQVEAWGQLVIKSSNADTKATSLIGHMCAEDVEVLAEHMHKALKAMCGTDCVSPTPPSGPNTPLAEAVAARTAARAAFWVNEDPDLNEAVTEAEFAVYAAPAATIDEVLWKHGEEMMHDLGVGSHAEAIAKAEDTWGLEAAAAAGVYRDLERLAAAERPSIIIAALDEKLAELFSVERELGDAIRETSDEVAYEAAVAKSGPIAYALMASPARTLADFRAKARAVEWACSSDWNAVEGKGTALDFMLLLVRELLGEAPSPKRLETQKADAGADQQLIDDIASTISLNTQAMRATLPGAQTDLLDAADAPLQRALGMTARTLQGLAARARLVETWLPNGNAREDLEWRVVQSLIRDVRAICGVPEHVTIETSLEALERRIDQAIAEIPFLASRKHGLTDDEFNKRLANGDELVAAIAALEGDDPVTQRLRIKALGWLSDYTPDTTVEFDDEERLLTALMRSACKQSPIPTAVPQRAPELLAAE